MLRQRADLRIHRGGLEWGAGLLSVLGLVLALGLSERRRHRGLPPSAR
jgi:hypothetical protein